MWQDLGYKNVIIVEWVELMHVRQLAIVRVGLHVHECAHVMVALYHFTLMNDIAIIILHTIMMHLHTYIYIRA